MKCLLCGAFFIIKRKLFEHYAKTHPGFSTGFVQGKPWK